MLAAEDTQAGRERCWPASIINVGSVAAVAMPISATPVSDVPVDPIYDAIEADRKAFATMQTAFAEHRKAHEIADAKVAPAHIHIPSMVNPGNTVAPGRAGG